MFSSRVLAAVLILLPALLRWWWTRGLARQLDDPALPERLLANQRRNQIVIIVCIILLIYTQTSALMWGVPLLLAVRAAAGFPFRKRLYGETWSVFEYLWFCTRLIAGAYGFWILLLTATTIIGWFGRFDWIAALGIGAVLCAWNEHTTDVLRRLLRAKPITDPALVPKFEEMARVTCGTTLARFEYVDLGGGAVANAVALPSLHRPGTLFSSTLLALLDRDEILAIAAHELAHLEYYDAKWLRRARLVNLALIALSVATAPLVRITAPSSYSSLAELMVIAITMVTLVWRAKDRQKNETTSDLRAVALCGDADALARGLTKLYAFARIPRRFDSRQERQATHPSLARRIRDIRAASGTAPAPLTAGTAAFTGSDGRANVTFGDTHVEWREHEGAAHTLSYAHLTELRVHAGPSGPARLVAVEKAGRRWEMMLTREQVPPLQTMLDSVDGRLASVAAPRLAPSVTGFLKFFCVLIAFSFGQITCALVLALAALRPGSHLIVAAGVAAIGSAALMLRDSMVDPNVYRIWISVMMAAMGCGLLVLARSTRRDEVDPPSMRPVAALAVVAAVLLLAVAVSGLNAVRLYQSAADFPGAAVAPLALAGALFVDRRRIVRRAGIVPAVVGVAVAAVGSLPFLDYVASDPFLVQANAAAIQAFDAAPSRQIAMAFGVSELRLSPNGRAMAVQEDAEDLDDPDDRRAEPFHVGRAGDPLRKIAADEVAFVDDDRAVALTFADGAADLREIDVDNPAAPRWHVRVPDITAGTLDVSRGNGEWHVLGWTRGRSIVSAKGHIGRDDVTRVEWTSPSPGYSWGHVMAAAGSNAVFVDTTYVPGPFRNPYLLGLYAAVRSNTESRLWHIVDGVRTEMALSRLEVDCATGAVADSLVCAGYDGARTRIVAIDVAGAHVTPVSTLWGHFRTSGIAAPGLLTGWLDSKAIVLRLATNEALRVPARPREWISAVAAADTAVGTVSSEGDTSTIRIYPLAQRSASR